jgi:hypothetical protein
VGRPLLQIMHSRLQQHPNNMVNKLLQTPSNGQQRLILQDQRQCRVKPHIIRHNRLSSILRVNGNNHSKLQTGKITNSKHLSKQLAMDHTIMHPRLLLNLPIQRQLFIIANLGLSLLSSAILQYLLLRVSPLSHQSLHSMWYQTRRYKLLDLIYFLLKFRGLQVPHPCLLFIQDIHQLPLHSHQLTPNRA